MTTNSNNKSNGYQAAKPLVWVKTNDGTTYICPKSELRDPKKVSKEELSQCMDESLNPQNNQKDLVHEPGFKDVQQKAKAVKTDPCKVRFLDKHYPILK